MLNPASRGAKGAFNRVLDFEIKFCALRKASFQNFYKIGMYEIYKFLHGIGILMTVGVITASLIYGWYKKLFPNNKLLTKIQFPYKWISPSVKIGLVVLIISGLGMYAERAEQFNSSAVFWIKMGFVLALVINNIWLNSILKPKGKKIFSDPVLANSPEALKLKKTFNFAENLSLFLWFTTMIVSFLLPEGREERGGREF